MNADRPRSKDAGTRCCADPHWSYTLMRCLRCGTAFQYDDPNEAKEDQQVGVPLCERHADIRREIARIAHEENVLRPVFRCPACGPITEGELVVRRGALTCVLCSNIVPAPQ
jgi:transcription elongation factor Elf1